MLMLQTLDVAAVSAGLLIGRLILGTAMAAHGAQKLFGWFGGHGLGGTGGFFETLGFRPGRLFALAAALGELGSGVLVALGVLGPIGPALMIAVMLVAMVTAHWRNGFFATSNGIELPLLYSAGALALAFTGPGLYSLDAVVGLEHLSTPRTAAIAVALALVAGIAALVLRRPAEHPQAAGAR